ncbi:MAG: hypothetical protein M3N47_09770 [Chloroflexota bacterium]|nr:hypothetical protein [Chloroflexota bacterium]
MRHGEVAHNGPCRQAGRTDNIDAMIALCMAVERAEHQPEPVELLGWL